MGAIGSSLLAGHGDDHKKVDAVAPLGGPLDVAYFLGGFERMQMGGFCSYAQLSALGDEDAANGTNKLNDPTQLTCPESTPFLYEHQQSFDHWQFTDDGGDFDRSSYLNLFFDLSLALGNPLYYNFDSPLFPGPGVTWDTYHSAQACENPVIYPGTGRMNANPVFNAEFNPEGKYDVVTFCDGQAPIWYCNDAARTHVDFCQASTLGVAADDPSYPQTFCNSVGATSYSQAGNNSDENWDLFYARKGVYDPCYPQKTPASFGLAVDYNGNHKRDYFEPVIINGHERFSDVGTDGCADAQEDGKGGCTGTNMSGDPNHDNFDPAKNPLGTEGDWKWEPGEPYEDNGLDGVPNTGDYGEANGQYDDGPNRQNWFAYDFRTNYQSWTPQERQSINVYTDGGLRDVFNFGLSGEMMASIVKAYDPNGYGLFMDYLSLPDPSGKNWSSGFDATALNFTKLPTNFSVVYGNANATVTQVRQGDGDHVGTPAEVIDRFETWIEWTSHLWQPVMMTLYPKDFDNGAPVPISTPGETQDVIYNPKALEYAPRNFDIALPPGYNDPKNADKRYPVVSLGHGYGMDPDGMANLSAITGALMSSGTVIPMIIIFPSGKCCFRTPNGTLDCREVNEEGTALSHLPGYVSECDTGTFYVNSQGSTTGGPIAYGDSLFELFDYVDAHYRTLGPKTVPVAGNP
jgi:hypothetical protein